MNPLDAAYVRSRTQRYDWSLVDFPAPEGSDPDPLDEEVLDAVEYVEGVTWRKLDDTMPDSLARRAAKAAIMRTQQQVQQEDADQVETASDELTSSFNASGYSENRRAFSDYGAANKALLVNKWPALNDLLWAVMTPEARSWWRSFLTGEMPGLPAELATGGFNVLEVAWDAFHAAPYDDVVTESAFRSTYLNPVDPGDLPYVPDPYGEPW